MFHTSFVANETDFPNTSSPDTEMILEEIVPDKCAKQNENVERVSDIFVDTSFGGKNDDLSITSLPDNEMVIEKFVPNILEEHSYFSQDECANRKEQEIVENFIDMLNISNDPKENNNSPMSDTSVVSENISTNIEVYEVPFDDILCNELPIEEDSMCNSPGVSDKVEICTIFDNSSIDISSILNRGIEIGNETSDNILCEENIVENSYTFTPQIESTQIIDNINDFDRHVSENILQMNDNDPPSILHEEETQTKSNNILEMNIVSI